MQFILPAVLVALVVGKIFEIDPVGSWSWWWVLAPLYPGVLIVLVFGGLAVLSAVMETPAEKAARRIKKASSRVRL